VIKNLPPFPPEFRFGVATADHQCEAYTGQDDIRDVWERVRGITRRQEATDFWNRYREDVDLARKMGCRAFRLSLSWARLEPTDGSWDADAFAHYRDVLQYMRQSDMATVVTLHHNTWPLHVQAAGNGAGMLDPGFPDRFVAYASAVAERLGDLIDYYVTINEPNQLVYGFIKLWCMRCYAMPPGLEPFATGARQMDAVLRLIPNLFRAHARAREAIRKTRPGALVGTNPLVLGLPRWLQRWFDRRATHLRNPEQLRSQTARVSQNHLLDSGEVDVSIAQLTITQSRSRRVLFSEPYFTAHLCALHHASLSLPQDRKSWNGTVGVVTDGAPAEQRTEYFPAAGFREYAKLEDAVHDLRRRQLDVVFDDDVFLQEYATDDLTLTALRGHDQHFAVAMALGSRALLNAVDIALREFKERLPDAPQAHNRKTVAHIGRDSVVPKIEDVPDLDASLQKIRRRGTLRVGVSPGVPGLCMREADGAYVGLEPDIARHMAARIFGTEKGKVHFVSLHGDRRVSATRSWWQIFDGIRKTISIFATFLGTNWWNLGLAGKLAPFLCPPECVGAIDYVGIDYYWGVPSILPWQLERLVFAADASYGKAPVWSGVLYQLLREQQQQFPGKPIIVIENGCVTTADHVARAEYITRHVFEVQRAVAAGIPVKAYICWSITSNREWGLPFDNNSDFGLYHIDLDHDPKLTRIETPASERYAQIIAAKSAELPAQRA
jgi:beta-glucosidase/6-phospho-beta-glucosidase/beta-galactosidase/ABC-type amino acid transport substrate-binding protein